MSAAVGDVEAGRVGERVARPVTIPALAGIGAGAIHAAAVGAHADHRVLANIFVVLAVSQLATGVALLVQPGRAVAKSVVAVNGFAVAGWLLSRTVGVWVDCGARGRAAGVRGFGVCVARCVGGGGSGVGVERGHPVGFDVDVASGHECS